MALTNTPPETDNWRSKIGNVLPYLRLLLMAGSLATCYTSFMAIRNVRLKEKAHTADRQITSKVSIIEPKARNDVFAHLVQNATRDNVIDDSEIIAIIAEASKQNEAIATIELGFINVQNATIIDPEKPVRLDSVVMQAKHDKTNSLVFKYKSDDRKEEKYSFVSLKKMEGFLSHAQSSSSRLGLKDIGFYAENSDRGSYSGKGFKVFIHPDEFNASSNSLNYTVDHEIGHLSAKVYEPFYVLRLVKDLCLEKIGPASTHDENYADSVAISMDFINNAKGMISDFSYGIIPKKAKEREYLELLKRKRPEDVHDSRYNRIKTGIRIAGRELNTYGL